jgi:hypothetical protein
MFLLNYTLLHRLLIYKIPFIIFSESLYGAFDRLAKCRHVFKVETIGDCYVAVTGLPEPRADHGMYDNDDLL